MNAAREAGSVRSRSERTITPAEARAAKRRGHLRELKKAERGYEGMKRVGKTWLYTYITERCGKRLEVVTDLAPVTGGPLSGPGPLAVPSLLEPLRKAYWAEVVAITQRLKEELQAGDVGIDNYDYVEDRAERLRLGLEEICARESMCRHWPSARVVLALSKHGDAVWDQEINGCGPPNEGDAWAVLAGCCLARDVLDEARRRGWVGKAALV